MPIEPIFRLAVRCLCIDGDRILLIKHRSPTTQKEFWALPGGLVEKGETLENAAKRELCEETGLTGEIAGVFAIQEFDKNSLVEIVFKFAQLSGAATLGHDPELAGTDQKRMLELGWFHRSEMPKVKPKKMFENLWARIAAGNLVPKPFQMDGD